MSRAALRWLPSALAFVVAVLVFAPLLAGDFIYDDHIVILRDPRVADPALWGEFFTDRYHPGVDRLYRPLVSLSYAIQWQLHGPDPLRYRVVNLLAHAACAAMVAGLGARLFGNRAGVLAGALFAVHPAYTEVIASIANRTEAMATFFALAAVWTAIRPLRIPRVLAAASLWVLAMLCKESVITLGPLLPAFAWLAQDSPSTPATTRHLRMFAGVMLLSCGGYLIVRETILPLMWDRRELLDWTVNAVTAAEGVDRLLLPIVILGHYLSMYVTTRGLAIVHEGVLWPQVSPGDPFLWIGFGGLFLGVVLAVMFWRRRLRLQMACLLGAAASYFVISNAVVLLAIQIGDRLLYLPTAFIVMLVGAALARMRYGAAAGIAIAVLLTIRTVHYLPHWKDNETLTRYLVEHHPQSLKPHQFLAFMQHSQGDLSGALATLEGARGYHPMVPDLWSMSAAYARAAGDNDNASAWTAEAERLEGVYPNNLFSRSRLMHPPLQTTQPTPP